MTSVVRVSDHAIVNRVATAVVSMAARHVFTILSGIVVARGLGPTQFGYFMFLLSGFLTLHTLLDLSGSQAFFTSICKQSWPFRLYAAYGCWLAFQLGLPLIVIALLLPNSLVADIWQGQSRTLVLMALIASFSQRVLWQAVLQIYEAHRLTVRIQITAAAIMAIHLLVVIALKSVNLLSAPVLFIAIMVEFAGVGSVMLLLLRGDDTAALPPAPSGVILREFAAYVLPLIVSLILSSANSFAEVWLIQIFGGPKQQAFFNVAQQYANIGLVLGYPAVNVFWKELTAAHSRDDVEGLRRIYTNGTRVLFAAPAFLAGFCVFWSTTIIKLLLGGAYAPAGSVFAVTLVNSIFQCLGLITSLAYLATGRTRAYSIIGVAQVAVSFPASLVLLWMLRLGALGLALKLTVLSLVVQFFSDWYTCRLHGWKTDNVFRVLIFFVFFAAGGLGYLLARRILPNAWMLWQMAFGFGLYCLILIPSCFAVLRAFGYQERIETLMALVIARVKRVTAM